MSKQKILILIILLFLIAAGALILLRGDEDTWLCNENGEWVKHGRPNAEAPRQACPLPKNNQNTNNAGIANPASVYCEANGGKLEIRIDSVSGGQIGICVFSDNSACEEWRLFRKECEPGKNIAVFSPAPNAEVSLPFKISGQARVFENQLNVRVKDSAGKIIYNDNVYANSPDMGQFGLFEKEITQLDNLPADKKIIIEALWFAPKDGAELDLIATPAILK